MKFWKWSVIVVRPSFGPHVRTQPQGRRVGANARQHFTGQQQDSPDDQDLRHDVREPHAPPPRRDAGPQAGSDDRRDAQQVEDQPQTAAMGVRPYPGSDPDPNQHGETHLHPRAEPSAAARRQGPAGWRAPSSRDRGPPRRRLPSRRAAERGVGERQLLEQPVDFGHLLVPVLVLLDPRHYTSRLSPYRSIFLYRLLRGISNVR